eukprot:scaffold468441_cov37-Prasinocladus_malaysianus.AAC.1
MHSIIPPIIHPTNQTIIQAVIPSCSEDVSSIISNISHTDKIVRQMLLRALIESDEVWLKPLPVMYDVVTCEMWNLREKAIENPMLSRIVVEVFASDCRFAFRRSIAWALQEVPR